MKHPSPSNRCPACWLSRQHQPLVRRARPAHLEVAGHLFEERIVAHECDRCHQRFDVAELSAFRRRVALHLAKDGIQSGAAIRLLRETARLDTSVLARLLGVTRQTIHRWETDRTPIDRATFLVLRLLLEDHLAHRTTIRDTLESLGKA